MELLQIKNKSVIISIGPSGAGKSTFIDLSKKYLQNTYQSLKVHVLSSDDIRRELLADLNVSKYRADMLHISEIAFNMLFMKLESYMQYPCNSDVIFIDTTGLSSDFRKKITTLTNKYHYNNYALLFDYKEKEDYFKGLTEEDYANNAKSIIHKHIDRFKKETLREITKKDYVSIFRVRSKNFSENDNFFKIEDLDRYSQCKLDSTLAYTIIGDVHGCYDEMIELIKKNGYIIEDGIIVSHHNKDIDHKLLFIGDLVDKGPKTKEVINFIYNNMKWLHIIKGNHENFVYKYANNIHRSGVSKKLLDKYFDSVYILEADKELLHKFNHIVENCIPYAETNKFIATHAPCKNKYLRKLDAYSEKKTRSTLSPNEDDYEKRELFEEAFKKSFEYLYGESTNNQLLHIFGHTTQSSIRNIKNKYFVDTGCVYGNKLSSMTIHPNEKITYLNVQSDQTSTKIICDLNNKKELVPLENSLIPYRIKNLAKDKVNFISGTMSPSDKDESNGILESLEVGLHYYKNIGVEEVILQKKYMGSRCQVYLSTVVEDSYAVSRNGFRIKENITHILKDLHSKYINYMNSNGIKLLIIDGELMPWSTLGNGLIEEHYKVSAQCVEKELSMLNEYNFFQNYKNIKSIDKFIEYKSESNTLKRNELINKYGNSNEETYSNYIQTESATYDEKILVQNLEIFNNQIDTFCKYEESYFNAFCVLKEVYEDNTEITLFDDKWNNMEKNFKFVSLDECVVINFSDNNYINTATEFYNRCTELENLEGIVIKPKFIKEDANCVPYMKVRNKNYLTFVYGYDYLLSNKYNKLLKKKGIRNKLKISMSEWKLASKLLAIPYNTIDTSNNEYVYLCSKMTEEIEKESYLDPRL